MKRWAFLGSAIIAEVAGSLSMKAAIGQPWLYLFTATAYVFAFFFLSATLRQGMALGAAYGIWGAAGVALTAVFSMVLFAEPITLLMGSGIAVVIAGVLCVELGALALARQPLEEN